MGRCLYEGLFSPQGYFSGVGRTKGIEGPKPPLSLRLPVSCQHWQWHNIQWEPKGTKSLCTKRKVLGV